MKTKTIVRKFNYPNICKRLNQLSIENENGTIVTHIGGKRSAEWLPKSKNYFLVDFKEMSKNFISQLKDKMVITDYWLKINGGIQELRLYGETYKLGGEDYQKMACLLSSTDGTRNMQVHFGLYRQVCENGMMALETGENFNARHLSGNKRLQELVQFDFGDMEKSFDEMRNAIDRLDNKTITLSKLREGIVEDKGRNATKFLAFVSKLISSKTDRLENLTPAQINELKNAKNLLDEKNAFDIEIPAHKAFQCYTELFRRHDSGQISKESRKILELV